jgi:hypothetical protein
MKKTAGLWIDHRKAFIVMLSDKGEQTKLILSNTEKQRGRFDGVRSNEKFEAGLVESDDRQQRDFTGHLDVFYKEVLDSIRDADSVLIMGPGEAKGEMKKMIDKNRVLARIEEIETDGKMTDPQIIAKVRAHFLTGKKAVL